MKILHLEDNPRDAELILRVLERDGLHEDVHVVATQREFAAALDRGGIGVILSDAGLIAYGGNQALDIARTKCPDVPFLVVSGHVGADEDVLRLKLAGATDCISKTELDRLAPAIRRALATQAATRVAPSSRYTRAMERLITVVQELSLARDLPAVMTIVRRSARALTGADGATFVLRESDTCYYADEDAIAPLWKGQRFPMSACISGWAMQNHAHAVIEDIYADPRIPHDTYRRTFVKSLAMVPIRKLAPIGAIGTYWARPHKPDAEEVSILQALADTTAVAMENVGVYAELEQRVRDRTAGLEAANKELEAFTYAVSHDLRAPLRHIEGYIDLLIEDSQGRLDAQGQRDVQQIRNAATRMGQLIEDLMNLSRVTQATLNRSHLDLSQIAREVLQSLQAAAPARRAELAIASNLTATGDPRLIRVVLENILGNAWKFTSRQPAARIEVGTVTTPAGQTAFCVRDNGAGFDMTHATKLFGVFQRMHSEAEFPGSGIGLATVQRVIHRHGGQIWAESAPGQGATFFFTLG